jgi:PAS domain S-box-containing protein
MAFSKNLARLPKPLRLDIPRGVRSNLPSPKAVHCMFNLPHFRWFFCGLAFWAATLPVRAEGSLEKVVLQLPFRHQFQFAGAYAAVEKGYFREEGLDVVVKPTSGQVHNSIDEVLAGRAEFGISQGPQLVSSRMAGMGVVVVAAIMQHSPQVLLTLASDNLNTPHDLVGKRVALDLTSLQSEVRLMLEHEGVGFDRVKVVPNNWDSNELLDGTADAMSGFIIDIPYEMSRLGKPVRIIRPLDYGVDFYGDCLFTSDLVRKAKPQLVAKMRRALLRGWDYALHHPDELINLIVVKYPAGDVIKSRPALDPDAMKYEASQTALLINADLIELGRINPGRWRHMGEVIRAYSGQGDVAEIEQMIYATPLTLMQEVQGRAHLLLWGLAIALVVVVASVLTNRRLQSLVRRRTEELQQSEQRQREYFDLAPAPIVIEDYTAIMEELGRLRAEGVRDIRVFLEQNPARVRELSKKKCVVTANRHALRRSGFDSVESMNRLLTERMTAQALEVFVDELDALWNDVDHLTLEKSYLNMQGELVHMLINWEVGRKDGRLDHTRVRLVFTDVTQQKKTEEALRESEARYRQIFEQAPISVVEFDYSRLVPWFKELREKGVTSLADYLEDNPDARQTVLTLAPITNVNQATLKIVGAGSKEELFKRMDEIFTESTVAIRCSNVVRVWDGFLSSIGEFEVRRLDGSIRTLSFQWQMYEENGVPTFGRTQAVLTDITDRLAAEKALRESEARYRELFEQAAGGIYRSSPDGTFLTINPGLARIFGFTRQEEMLAWMDKNEAKSLYVKPGRRQEFIAAMDDQGQVADFESEVRHRSGGTIWISENARTVRDKHGHALYYEGFVTDITARRHLEEEMARASKLEAVGLLAGGIAHDYNNILTVVLGNITLAEADTDADNAISARLADARRATLRARDLTLQLLTFAKGGEPVKTSLELPELLKEVTNFSLHGSKVRSEFKLTDGLWAVHADKGQIGQVLQNLVINSVQAMPGGGVITISAENCEYSGANAPGGIAAGRYVHLSVSDVGVGIPRENLAKIFDPYFTTKPQGTGLGLATCYSIIKKHAGHVEVESATGRGTTFHLWLPAIQGQVTSKGSGSSGSRSPFRVRILFMDDEATIRGMAEIFMQRLGFDCDLVADGAEAVKKYQEALEKGRKYSLVLMDLTVPGGMGGREAMEQLRRLDPSVCAIVSSGYSRDPVMSNYHAHGFRAVLPKPYGLAQLRKVVQETLDESGVSG